MKPFYIFKLALISIFSNKLRTALTIIGIGACVAITVFLIALNAGLKSIISSELKRPEFSNLITANPRASDIVLNESVVSMIKLMNNVSKVEYISNLSGTINYHGKDFPVPIYGLSEGYFSVVPVTFVEGRSFEFDGKKNQVILNEKAIELMGIEKADEKIGTNINLSISVTENIAPEQEEVTKAYPGIEYEIVGIINKGDLPLVYVPLTTLSELGVKNYNQLKILATEYDKISLTEKSIEQLGFNATISRDTVEQFSKIFSLFNFILIVFVVLTLLVSVFGTVNTISISLVEQTRQIGFLRLLGIREKDVRFLFIFEAIVLMFLGSVIGILLSWLLIFLGNKWISIIATTANYSIGNILEISYLVIIVVLVVSLIIGWLTGIKPAKRAVKIDPLAALRF